jgi:aromatic ring-opening dioxygenase LigB subunit
MTIIYKIIRDLTMSTWYNTIFVSLRNIRFNVPRALICKLGIVHMQQKGCCAVYKTSNRIWNRFSRCYISEGLFVPLMTIERKRILDLTWRVLHKKVTKITFGAIRGSNTMLVLLAHMVGQGNQDIIVAFTFLLVK